MIYSQAAIPDPYVILGLKLRPLSLGHYLLMSRFDVAFVASEERNATFDDLILGVLICSMGYDDFLRFMESKNFRREIAAWGRKIGLFDPVEKIVLFNQYIREGSKAPLYWIEKEGRNNSGAHWTHALKTTLVSKCGYTNSEALNAPLSQALSDYFQYAESEGFVRLMTEDEIKQVEA